jgi:hypothetical protein
MRIFKMIFLLVINNFGRFPGMKSVSSASSEHTSLLTQLFSNGNLDSNCGNWKLDFGFSSGQNLERDLKDLGITRPRLLDQTTEPLFAVCGILGSGEQTRIESCIIRIPESMVESQHCSPN